MWKVAAGRQPRGRRATATLVEDRQAVDLQVQPAVGPKVRGRSNFCGAQTDEADEAESRDVESSETGHHENLDAIHMSVELLMSTATESST